MLFAKKNHLIGVDIGSRTIKLGEVVEKKEGWLLKSFGMSDLPQGAIVEGRIKEPETVANTIKELVQSLKIKEQNVAISISGYSVIIKKIVVAKTSDEELSENIQYEAEQYIPFNVEDVNIDFQILGDHELNPNQMNVMLVAAKAEVINEYLDLLEMADLTPNIIDVDVFALEKVFENSYLLEEKSVALVDIGANKLNVNIVKNNTSAFTRDVAIGGEEITREIVNRFKCSFEEAEEIKLGKATDKIPQKDLRNIMRSVVSNWCSEIRRVIDFYYSTYPDETIKQILLSGGATQTPGFLENMAAETSSEVGFLDPFKGLEISEKDHDIDYLKHIAPQASICIGLASRRVGDK
ncbi:MAG: type IV pilus assembly protein PilM [Deltaproteobacteria bacterium]|nr:type IV pilus assembly protein PilM [Deltaproteobacteria bacterium]MBW2264830.1 type IV pilus assembly protein PilM [Deltaproteobacteria bacterium]MBW2318232.1 type IV pilus assembly protein PilM [Deltaproteobacteria bacterium]MBW2600853.1 type IV pilus assembly protein PilM [Deltaproteobacteria bacterium]OEU45579.1 MAG: pilus assembly protein PilM [Desulfobacterales bacterium S7086C20]